MVIELAVDADIFLSPMTATDLGAVGILDLKEKACRLWLCFSQLACIVHIISKIRLWKRISQKNPQNGQAVWI